MNLALVGNPNTGKTTFFNSITGLNEKVGNWHGVTVDKKTTSVTFDSINFTLIDLPGVYSLNSFSFEEMITRDFLLNNKSKIINICDANNLKRNMYLLLQLLELNLDVSVCINMANELKKNNISINTDLLSKKLNCNFYLLNAQNKTETKSVMHNILKNTSKNFNLPYLSNLQLDKVLEIIKSNIQNSILKINNNAICIKVLEKDEYIINLLNLSEEQQKKIDNLFKEDTLDVVSTARYNFLDDLFNLCIEKNANKKNSYGYSKLDKLVLNKYLCLPIFLILISFIFFITFVTVGAWLSDMLSLVLNNYIFAPISNFLVLTINNIWVINFIENAIFGGVGSIVSFLPQIAILLLFLGLLEDSGYLSRLAFTLEDYFGKIGLTGKSVFTLLMGFGCSTTACITSRTLDDKNSKIKTAILSSYLSCSAKLPIYSVLCTAFFADSKFFVIIGMYLLSVVVAILISYFLDKTLLKSGEQNFIMELPPYRFPRLSKIFRDTLTNIKDFLIRIGTILISFSCLVWILQNCNFKLQFGTDKSILKYLGEWLSVIFYPLGFGSWGITSAIICGIVAKELIVSTFGIINGINGENLTVLSMSLLSTASVINFTKESAFSFMIFALLYFPCVSTISVLLKEIGVKWTVFSAFLQFAVAYIISFAFYRIAIYIKQSGWIAMIISLIVFLVIFISLVFVKKYFMNKNKCKYCKKQNCGFINENLIK